jgi:hypothetical protein
LAPHPNPSSWRGSPFWQLMYVERASRREVVDQVLDEER